MPANINNHVARFHRFLPFSAAHDQIYEEYQTGDDDLDLETVAISYAAKAIKSGARCVILTGDAGHGKTHLCRRLIQEGLLGYDNVRARHHLLESCDGNLLIPPAAKVSSPSLRIHKDLSEIQPPSRAARFLEDVGNHKGEALLVCANEGRLRAIISSHEAGQVCSEISSLFSDSFTTGVTASKSGHIHIINLNYQSVAAKSAHKNGSLLRRVLASWVGDGRRWGERSACASCSNEKMCPIRRNRTLLVEQGDLSEIRLRRLEDFFQVVERLGHVVTIREMLMLVAYLITGGLTCSDVDKQVIKNNKKNGWQHAWAFYNLLFECPPDLPNDRAEKGMPILAALRRLDPGAIAIRTVDEKILNKGEVFEFGELDLTFLVSVGGRQIQVDAALGIDDFSGNPQSRADLQREAEVTKLAVATLRRRAFFDNVGADVTLLKRLGFIHGDTFLRLLDGELPPHESVKIKNAVISGLHNIQGLRIGRHEITLYLVDPAFGKASSDAAIISRQIPSGNVNLDAAGKAWRGDGVDEWLMPSSVDWLDRTVMLGISESQNISRTLALDLLSFECISRAASGYVSEAFYANEIRRIRTFLGQLAESTKEDDSQITIFMRDQLQNVALDMGVIQVGGV
jgi:hypothetical protein